MSENGNGHTTVTRDCGQRGHSWGSFYGAPAPRVCTACPAIGGPCPDCGSTGADRSSGAKCRRCEGSGTVELVEISAAEVALLRLDRRRWQWLIAEWAHHNRISRATATRQIDELICLTSAALKLPRETPHGERASSLPQGVSRGLSSDQKSPDSSAAASLLPGESPAGT